MNAKFMDLVKQKAIDAAEEMWKSLHKYYDDQAPGMHPVNDLQHRVWFEDRVMRDPDWARAMAEHIPGGMREISRYERTVGLRGEQDG